MVERVVTRMGKERSLRGNDHPVQGASAGGIEAARATDAYFTALVRASGAAMIGLAGDGTIQSWNPAAERLFGYTPVEAVGRPITLLAPPGPGDEAEQQAIMACLRVGEPASVETVCRAKDGQSVQVQLNVAPVVDAAGGLVLIAATLTNITERKRAEAASAERARLLDLSNDAIIVRDVHDRIIYWNHGATELYGWTRAEALGQDLHSLLRTEFEAPFEQMIIALQQHDRLEGEVVQVTRDGRRITVSSRWALDRDVEGRPGAILTTYNDITARKQVEAERARLLLATEQARQDADAAVQLRDEFLSIASHELRTPLTSLLGYAMMLQAPLDDAHYDGAVRQRQAAAIVRQTLRLDTLIGHLLDVTRLQRGQFALEQQLVDLGALVTQGVEAFRLTLPPGAPHTIALAHPGDPIEVVGDSARLEEVLHNLLSNAVKYSPTGGTVAVRVAVEADEVVLDVADHGIGIPAAAQGRLFEPFYRAGNMSPQISGFGIGLYVVQEIVQRHGGRIELESAEGAGSRFRVVLPRYMRGG